MPSALLRIFLIAGLLGLLPTPEVALSSGYSQTAWDLKPASSGTTDGIIQASQVTAVAPSPQPAILPALVWNTFLGGSGLDSAYAAAADASGNLYLIGDSDATWGSPVRSYAGGGDAFVAKLSAGGALQWSTFLGGAGNDVGRAIAVDANGNVFVAGMSGASWGSPVLGHAGGERAFAAKLDGGGALQWNTFLGWHVGEYGRAIAVKTGGNIYVAGNTNFGSGLGTDAFVAELTSSGGAGWVAFFGGGPSVEYATALTVDMNGNIYVAGTGDGTWGSPIRPYTEYYDVFAAKLDGSGGPQWTTFLGGNDDDAGNGVAVDTAGNVYVVGDSYAGWGSPVRSFSGSSDGFAAKLDGSGYLQWNTFLGSSSSDSGDAVSSDTSGNIHMAGHSLATWGSPFRPHSGSQDAYAVKLGGNGDVLWNAFLGGTGPDVGRGLAVSTIGNVYTVGQSDAAWGSPFRPYSANGDAFAAKLSEEPVWRPRHAIGDFDGDGADEAAVDFGADGVWMYKQGAWSQLTPSNPESLIPANVDADGAAEIIADLGPAGLWLWNAGGWSQLSAVNVESLAAGDVDADGSAEVAADFAAVGLWLYNGGSWSQLSGANLDHAAMANLDGSGGAEIIGDFGAIGLWLWNAGSWTQLSGVDADFATAGDFDGNGVDDLLGDFGSTGLWLWNAGSWTQLSGVDADYVIAVSGNGLAADAVAGDFGTTGLWNWAGGVWSILSGVNADYIVSMNIDGSGVDEVAADFGTTGLWLWNGSAWSQLSGINPEYVMAGDTDGDSRSEMLADFGPLGLWLYDAAWAQISGLNPD